MVAQVGSKRTPGGTGAKRGVKKGPASTVMAHRLAGSSGWQEQLVTRLSAKRGKD